MALKSRKWEKNRIVACGAIEWMLLNAEKFGIYVFINKLWLSVKFELSILNVCWGKIAK